MVRILIVDDEANDGGLAAGLTSEGFLADAVPDAVAAMKSLTERPADVVLLDLMMPHEGALNGFELAREVRRRWPATQVLLTCAYPLTAQQLRGADCGAIGFVSKPWHTCELARFIRSKL